MTSTADTVFMDPPDNIGLGYNTYDDNRKNYFPWLLDIIRLAYKAAPTVYVSFNAKHMTTMGCLLSQDATVMNRDVRWLIQGFTFGQNNKSDFTNNFRPIVRISTEDAPRFPDQVRRETWRMKNGDKRANPEGAVPGDVWRSDFLEYARVTGNSKQRRPWHPTQLHEGLVEDLLAMSTPPGGTVIDPFAGTGTTMRVCMANGWNCSTCDIDLDYCRKIATEHDMTDFGGGVWHCEQ